jgi:hypothetical protein
MIDPQTPAEWQDAVDAAHAALALESARMYGLVEGGPQVNVDRCVEIVDAGKERGVTPRDDAVERFIRDVDGTVS